MSAQFLSKSVGDEVRARLETVVAPMQPVVQRTSSVDANALLQLLPHDRFDTRH